MVAASGRYDYLREIALDYAFLLSPSGHFPVTVVKLRTPQNVKAEAGCPANFAPLGGKVSQLTETRFLISDTSKQTNGRAQTTPLMQQ